MTYQQRCSHFLCDCTCTWQGGGAATGQRAPLSCVCIRSHSCPCGQHRCPHEHQVRGFLSAHIFPADPAVHGGGEGDTAIHLGRLHHKAPSSYYYIYVQVREMRQIARRLRKAVGPCGRLFQRDKSDNQLKGEGKDRHEPACRGCSLSAIAILCFFIFPHVLLSLAVPPERSA